jgi:S1-C subfamily serine protease
MRPGRLHRLRASVFRGGRLRLGGAVLAVAAALVVAVGAGLARARAGTIGTGVVVIDTTLAYQGGQAAGTGMVLTSTGEVLTNNHVIEGATAISVVVPGTGRSYSARVVGYDVRDDVAVLQLKNAANLTTVSVGAATLRVGQSVTATGNAGGTGRLSTVAGTITGLTRTITAGDGDGNAERLTGLIEIDAAVVAGDSGGPLEDASGRVIGMVTAASASAGFGFRDVSAKDAYAIPIHKAVTIAHAIEAGTTTARIHVGGTAFLGVSVTTVDAVGFGIGSGGAGAVVAGVAGGSPAARAGLEAGDVIVRVGGKAVASSDALRTLLLSTHPGQKVTVSYLDRFGSRHTVSVTLGSGPPQ